MDTGCTDQREKRENLSKQEVCLEKRKLICFHSGLLSPYKFNEIDSLNWYAEQKYRRDESQQ